MNPLRILLVDDSPPIRTTVRSLLSSRHEWPVCGEASDGQGAIDLAHALRPDAVLMDISMPRMDGLEATRRIRAELPEVKVIIVSQNDPAIMRLQAKQVGAHAYVGKSDLARDIFPALEALFPSRNGDGSSSSQPPASPASPMQSQDSPGHGHWPIGGGEMGERIRNMDWGQTPLGPAPSWSPALRMMVNFLLANRFPQLLWWGPQFISLYNDAYIPVLGAKHPWALGKPGDEVWSEIWDVLKPLVETPFSGGPATWIEDIPLELKRHGFTEETHFTISYSAVPDETVPGGVGGVLATVHEITEKVVSERRLQALRDIGAGSVEPKSAEEACELAARSLSAHPADIPFVAFYLLDDKGQPRLASAAGFESTQPNAAGEDASSLAPASWPFAKAIETQEMRVLTNLKVTLASIPRGPWSDPPDAAALVPIRSTDRHELAGFMVAGLSSRLEFDEQYRNFLELVSTQVATNIANARAYEEARKRAEALAEIDRAKTTFFSNVSHEFRTPLTLMLSPVEDLLSRDQSELPAGARNQLEMVRRNGNRLLRLVNSLLDFSRIEAGRVQASYQPTDLAALTTDLASGFRSATERAGLKLVIRCPALAEPVYVDHDMWEKIVLNLVSNAFKFTFDGEIAVSLEHRDGYVELSVRDTGIGISAEELPKLFDRFHRVEHARSRTHEGSGIGLALVNELVKVHGGSLRAESVSGEGSRFIVTIPMGESHLPADRVGKGAQISPHSHANPFVAEALRWLPEAPEGAPVVSPIPARSTSVLEAGAAGTRSRVLVADDNADMRAYLLHLLGDKYDVEAVADGKAALESALRNSPDLVLSDVMMPEMDGFALLRELRAHPDLRETPIILLSARAGEESRIEGIETGADDYLVKPFSARELTARVETHLKLSRMERCCT